MIVVKQIINIKTTYNTFCRVEAKHPLGKATVCLKVIIMINNN